LTARPRRWLLPALGLAAFAVVWILAAHALWKSTVPGDLHLPDLHPRSLFSQSLLDRTSSYERFLDIDALLAQVALVAVFVVYARRGHLLMRESAAGPIGTGMLLGMLGLGIVWLAQLPFGLAGLWWQRKHHVSHSGYVEWIVGNFLGLGGRFLYISFALLVAMGLARLLRGWWWIPGAGAFVGLMLLLSFVSPYLLPSLHPLRDRELAADARKLARRERVPDVRVSVQRVRRFTSAPNAEATGFGSTRRVVLWDTLLGGRFSRREVRVVIAHELGHLSRDHVLKSVGWFGLFALPTALAIALATRGRGGMARPEAVPVALLVLVVLQLLAQPLENIRSRHMEAEADWIALQASRDPAAARRLFGHFASLARENPSPPTWSYVLNASHPTLMQRLAMVQAWEDRRSRATATSGRPAH
jgi:STE24 endopeptidase